MENPNQRNQVLKKAKPKNNYVRITRNTGAPVNVSYQTTFTGRKLECTVQHRELVTSIAGGEFSFGTYKIQPGLALSFPWLSSIAPAFETYEIVKMDYEFVSRLPTTIGGIVYMAVDYDAGDPAIVDSEQQISQYAGCKMTKVWQNLRLPIEKSKMRRAGRLFTRSGALPEHTAIQDYDVGSLLYVVAGTPTGAIGSLYVNYTIKFTVPQAFDGSLITNNSLAASLTEFPNNVTNCFALHIGEGWAPYNNIQQGLNIVVNTTELYFENLSAIGRYIYDFTIELASGTTTAIMDSIASTLSSFQLGNTMQALSYGPELVTNTMGLVRGQTASGSWLIQGAIILVASQIGQRFGLNLASHTSLPGTNIIRILSRIAPYKF